MKRILLIGVLSLAIMLLVMSIPIQSTTVPEWRIMVIDERNVPQANAWVRQHWQNYSFESDGHVEDSRTNMEGIVVFPERRTTATIGRRVYYPIGQIAMYLFNASFGPDAHIISQHDGYEGWLDYDGRAPLPHTLVIRYRIQ
jgi:hypothetical protein